MSEYEELEELMKLNDRLERIARALERLADAIGRPEEARKE